MKRFVLTMASLAMAGSAVAGDKDFNGTFVATPTRDGRSGTVQLSLKGNELTFVFTPRGATAPLEDVTCVLGGDACEVRKAIRDTTYRAHRDGDAIVVEHARAGGVPTRSQRTLRLTGPNELTMTWVSGAYSSDDFKYARQQ
jgi:hypothetical protein